jgi:hypothetical protein
MSFFKKITGIFQDKDSEDVQTAAILDRLSNEMGLGEEHMQLANIVCIKSNGKLSPEDAFDLVSKNKMRILLKERRNASKEEMLAIADMMRVDCPHLTKEESETILELLMI